MSTHSIHWHETVPATCQQSVLTLGNFDGVHRGHYYLIKSALELASQLNSIVVAVTFDPHPLSLLEPERFQPPLTTIKERSRLLHSAGVQHVVVLQTTPELLKLSALTFFEQFIRDKFQPVGMVEGTNFRFGHNREGDVDQLTDLCLSNHITLNIVEPFLIQDEVVSSSRVRKAITSGNIEKTNNLLGHPYRIAGIVTGGQCRGTQIGFPTANLSQITTILPREGVYAGRAYYQKQIYPAACNIGTNPTFAEIQQKVEAHLIGYSGDLYGELLEIEFLERLRDTVAFASVEELIKQLQTDVNATQSIANREQIT